MRVSNISPIFMQSPAEIFPANKPESSPKQDAFTEYLPAQQRGPVIFHETPIEKPIESNSTKTAYNHEKDSRVAAKVNIEYNQEHVENESIIAKKTSEKLHNLFNTTLFNLLKKKFRLSASTRMIEFSLADTVVETIKLFLFQLSGLSEHLNSAVQNNFIENFKNNMQSLEQKIGNYNTSSMYKNPEKMLLLLQAMVQFLKENISIQFSPDMLTMLDKTMHLATICCDLCKAENIIFSTTNAPVQVLAQFQESIDETQNLSKKEYSNDLVFAIYKKQGSVQNVIQNWNDFKKNPLYKTPVNRQYAAFLTLLLLFENTIIATAMVINEINLEYSAISTTPIIINIA